MKPFSLFLTALLLLTASGALSAASLLVRPTTVVIPRGESAASVTITNSGDQPITAQVRVFEWDQDDNEDQLTETDDLAASPPQAVIAPGQSQTVRLVRTSDEAVEGEESYRLLVDEIQDRSATAGNGVVIQLRYSVPVFVMSRANASARLALTATWVADALQIDAANRGAAHAQISNVSLQYPDGTSVLVGEGLVGYVLPDESRQWRLDLPADGAPSGDPESIRALVNGEEMIVRL